MEILNEFLSKLISKYLPSAFVIAVLMTFFVFVLGLILQGESVANMTMYWGDGFWDLLSFSMQMVLILVTGGTLAKAKLIDSALIKISKLAKNNFQAALLVTLVSCLACFINWGFGLVVSALLAMKVIKDRPDINAALILASSYSGFLVWHGGFSGSIPLKLTDPSPEIKQIIGNSAISLSETIFSDFNLLLTLSVVLSLVIINTFMSFSKYSSTKLLETKKVEVENISSPSKLESSQTLGILFALMGSFFVFLKINAGENLSLNMMIFIFMIIGVLLHKNFYNYQKHFKSSLSSSYGIILQFPLYAGIMGMMNGSMMAQDLSNYFISISTKETFLLNTYLSAGLLNFFVPSGGGQWVIQGPIIMSAAKSFNVDFAKAALAISWGDAWSNMVQPFWALPLLAISQIELSDLMAYLIKIFLFTGLVSSVIFLCF